MNYNYNDYSTTSYGGGGGGGGGFMTSGSQQSPSTTRTYKEDTLRPVTIKQLNEAESIGESDFKVDGVQMSQVTFVGQVRNISTQTTNITYKIDDGTGTIEAKQWLDSDTVDNSTSNKIKDNAYVRVWGKLKSFGNRRHVGAHFIRPITDYNEISYHLLEATAVHLHFARGRANAQAKGGAANGTGQQQPDTSMTYGGISVPSGLSATARKIFQCIATTPQGNEGLHCEDIASRIGMNTSDVVRGGEELLEHSLIYSTVDDHTWAILNTDGMGM